MKTKTGMSIGLALTLMVGVFATMLALGLFTTPAVQAQETETSVGPGALTFTPGTVDTVAAVTVQFTTSADGAVVADGTISIEFPATAFVPDTIAPNTVTIDPPDEAAKAVMVSGQTVTLTVTTAITANTPVTVAFLTTPGQPDADPVVAPRIAGIRTPVETTTQTVKVSTSGDTKAVASTPSDALTYAPSQGLVGVKVAHTPPGADAAARVQIDFYSPSELIAGVSTITIEFNDDVQVPASLSEGGISVIGIPSEAEADPPSRVAANPSDVTVTQVGNPADEDEVTLIVPDMNGGDEGTANLNAGLVSVVFRQSAGIKNPTAAGNWPVKVKTSEDGDKVTSLANRSLTTLRELSLNNKSGKRGVTATASGRGFKNDTTATVWLEKTGDNVQGSGEPTLCTAPIGKNDRFSCTFLIGAEFSGSETNYVHAKDGELRTAEEARPWSISPRIKAVPRSAAIGDKVTIQVRDFGDRNLGALQFTLGGEDVVLETYSSSGGSADVQGTVPDETALGVQTLAAWIGGGRTKSVTTTTMTIGGAQVEVRPSRVVPNQSVTITGRGFSGREEISEPPATQTVPPNLSQVLIGGTRIMDWDKINGGEPIEINSGGSWVAQIVIPVTSTTTAPGTYELKIIDSEGRPGVTSITIPDRTVTFDPLESRVGTTLTVSGAGWIASNGAEGAEDADIELTYESSGGDSSSRATPDANGEFTATIKVPLNAGIPSTNSVAIEYTPEDSDVSKVSETVAHRVPGAGITLTPSSGPGGTLVTMTGSGFKAFTSLDSVFIGNLTISPRPAGASVGRDGVLESVQLLIPALDPGTHTIKAEVGGQQGAVVSAPFTITADDAAPTTGAGDVPVADALQTLIDNMVNGSPNLVDAYLFDGDAQRYLSFVSDPALASLNDLVTVKSGDVLWIRVQESQMFAGKTLSVPWTQVVLP